MTKTRKNDISYETTKCTVLLTKAVQRYRTTSCNEKYFLEYTRVQEIFECEFYIWMAFTVGNLSAEWHKLAYVPILPGKFSSFSVFCRNTANAFTNYVLSDDHIRLIRTFMFA